MIVPAKVNKNIKNSLTNKEKEEAYKLITEACTKKFLNPSKKVDLKRVKEIFNKYFNKENPIVDINEFIPGSEFNPLMTASWLGYYEESKELLDLNADPCGAPSNKATVLHICATNNKTSILHLCLQKYPEKVNSTNMFGQTALMNAAEAGHLEIVKELIETYKADPEITDCKGRKALDYAKSQYHVSAYLKYYDLDSKLADKEDNVRKVRKI